MSEDKAAAMDVKTPAQPPSISQVIIGTVAEQRNHALDTVAMLQGRIASLEFELAKYQRIEAESKEARKPNGEGRKDG